MKRVAILISGGGSNMVALARDMVGDHLARPVLVVSNVPDAPGLKRAEGMEIQTAVVDHRPFAGDRDAFEQSLNQSLDIAKPDIICLAGFMRILTPAFIERWSDRILNIHPSLLPKYKGLHTHERALKAGDAEAGCTVHLVTPELDDGPILGQARVPVLDGDTPDSLAARVLKQEHLLYPVVLRRFAAGDSTPLRLPTRGEPLINGQPA